MQQRGGPDIGGIGRTRLAVTLTPSITCCDGEALSGQLSITRMSSTPILTSLTLGADRADDFHLANTPESVSAVRDQIQKADELDPGHRLLQVPVGLQVRILLWVAGEFLINI